MKTKSKPLPMGVQMLGHFADRIAEARITPKMLAAEEMYEALSAFLQLPHLFDDVCDRGSDCKVCKAILLGTEALAKADGRND